MTHFTDDENAEYWNNRSKGQRGQGKLPRKAVAFHVKPDWPNKPVSKKAKRKQSRRWRREQAA